MLEDWYELVDAGGSATGGISGWFLRLNQDILKQSTQTQKRNDRRNGEGNVVVVRGRKASGATVARSARYITYTAWERKHSRREALQVLPTTAVTSPSSSD